MQRRQPTSRKLTGPTGPFDCPVGTLYRDGQCVRPDPPTCADGEVLVDGQCWPIDPEAPLPKEPPEAKPPEAQPPARAGFGLWTTLLVGSAALSLLYTTLK